MDNSQTFGTTVLPQSLSNHALMVAHYELGHNGSTRTYML